MIRLEIDDWCEPCADFEADVEKEDRIDRIEGSLNKGYVYKTYTNTTITCKHLKRCRNVVASYKKIENDELKGAEYEKDGNEKINETI